MSTRGHAAASAVAGLLVAALTPLAAGMPWPACGGNTTGNYTSNSTYGSNLRLVAAALPGNVSTAPFLFATAATGTAPNKVYALGQCRGDQDASACRDCIAAAFRDAQRLCPDKRDAAIFYDLCQIRFSDRDFLTSTTNSEDQEVQLYNAQNITSDIVVRFNATAYELLNAMADYVASTKPANRFVTGAIGFDATYPNIYGLASCTPDLTAGQCRGCLAAAIAEYPQQFPPNTKAPGSPGCGAPCGMRCTLSTRAPACFSCQAAMLVCFFLAGIFFSAEKNN